jgi:hypothetical protein
MTTTLLSCVQGLAGPVAHHSLGQAGSCPVDVADDLVGLHNTTASGPYLSLRARVAGFRREDLDELMYQDWELARFRAMRMTMFVFGRDLLEIAAAATRPMTENLAARWISDSGMSLAEFARLADLVEMALGGKPLTVRSLRKVTGLPKHVDVPGVVGRLCDIGRLVGGAAPKSWRSPVREFHRWADVLPTVDLYRWTESDAVDELVRRYVVTYGPVTLADVAWWTGFGKTRCRAALEAIADLREVAIADWPGPLYVCGEASALDLDDSVSALPVLDPYVQGYRDRWRFLDRERFDWVYDGGGNSAATLVHRGRIIGVWQFVTDPADAIRYYLFGPQPKHIRSLAEEDLAAAGAMYFGREADVAEVPEMPSLRADGGRSAMHPLDTVQHRA